MRAKTKDRIITSGYIDLLKGVIEMSIKDIVTNEVTPRYQYRQKHYRDDAIYFITHECKDYAEICNLNYNQIISFLLGNGYIQLEDLVK